MPIERRFGAIFRTVRRTSETTCLTRLKPVRAA